MAGVHIVATGTKKSLRFAGTNLWLLQEICPKPCTTQNRSEKTFGNIWRNLLLLQNFLRIPRKGPNGHPLELCWLSPGRSLFWIKLLWKTGWDADVAPSALRFRHRDVYNDPLAELSPSHPSRTIHKAHPFCEKPVRSAVGTIHGTFSHSFPLGCKEGWNIELRVARSALFLVAWDQTHPDLHPNHIQFQVCNLAKCCWRVHKL